MEVAAESRRELDEFAERLARDKDVGSVTLSTSNHPNMSEGLAALIGLDMAMWAGVVCEVVRQQKTVGDVKSKLEEFIDIGRKAEAMILEHRAELKNFVKDWKPNPALLKKKKR